MRCRRAICLVLILLGDIAVCSAAADQTPADFVRGIVDAPNDTLDFARAKLAVDKFADPSIDETAVMAELSDMVIAINKMLGTLPPQQAATDMAKMKALRTFLYEGGQWNNGKPFQYDFSDPLGRKPDAQLLTKYLETKTGNCISMPMLFLALGERLGLDLTLSKAPSHVFVKFTDRATGKTWNLETTSGAGFTRDEYFRSNMPMTDEAIANGVYLKTMTRREALGVIATGVLDRLMATGRYDDAIAVADMLIETNPANAYAMVKKGTAYYRILERDFMRKYPKESDIPAAEMPRAVELGRANLEAFAQAEALGWREPQLKAE